jgi:hypothetical protein
MTSRHFGVASKALLATLDEALTLLGEYPVETLQTADPLPSLLSQCEAFCDSIPAPQPVRTIHHLACTGGTLISKCLAALPNTLLLSEINPLSTQHVQVGGEHFSPTDLLLALRLAVRPLEDDILIRVFLSSMTTLLAECSAKGLRLVLRDHAHSSFCVKAAAASRPTLHELISRELPRRSVITVRHPIDSFLALEENKWTHFSPFTLEEYSLRYEAFLDRHEGIPVCRYEDFVAAPEATLEQICDYLELPILPGVFELISAVTLTGDSGRRSVIIEPRPRRPVPDALRPSIHECQAYRRLCERFDYPSATD